MVTIEVGGANNSEKVKFHVHRKVLCDKIPFFKAMFMGEFSEAATQTATLPEDNPEAFKLLVTWVYTGSLASDTFDEKSSLQPLFHLFILGEKLCLPGPMDLAIDLLVELLRKHSMWPSLECICEKYETTYVNSKLRLFLARIVVWGIVHPDRWVDPTLWSAEKIQDAMANNHDLWLHVIHLLRGNLGVDKTDPRRVPACDYHQHGKNEPCPHGGKSTAA